MPVELPSGPPPIPRNQTPPDWISAGGEGGRGTGLFLVLDPAADESPPLHAVAFPGITYAQALLLGELAAAFKWVPPELVAEIDSEPPPCVGRCAATGYCMYQIHCWCLEGRCQLRPLTR